MIADREHGRRAALRRTGLVVLGVLLLAAFAVVFASKVRAGQPVAYLVMLVALGGAIACFRAAQRTSTGTG